MYHEKPMKCSNRAKYCYIPWVTHETPVNTKPNDCKLLCNSIAITTSMPMKSLLQIVIVQPCKYKSLCMELDNASIDNSFRWTQQFDDV